MRGRRIGYAAMAAALLLGTPAVAREALRLGDKGYLTAPGLDVIVFDDIYPDGHQTGVTNIQQGTRVAANGDLRLEPEPGQWSPMPAAVGKHVVDPATNTITQALRFPDPDKNGHGFNPIFYPDLDVAYRVSVSPEGSGSFRIVVDLDKPMPKPWAGRIGFNLELFPGALFGRAWLMDGASGIFPRQPEGPIVRAPVQHLPVPRNAQANGPVQDPNGQPLGAPLATGRTLVVAPESDGQRLRIESRTGTLQLIDGRIAHNNGWFVVRGIVAAGAAAHAIEWIITPAITPGWMCLRCGWRFAVCYITAPSAGRSNCSGTQRSRRTISDARRAARRHSTGSCGSCSGHAPTVLEDLSLLDRG